MTHLVETKVLDVICRKHTAFSSFSDLVETPGYRPSIDMREPWGPVLANAYNAEMLLRRDERRAFKYGTTTGTDTHTSVMIVTNSRGIEIARRVLHGSDVDGDFSTALISELRHIVLLAGDTITLEPAGV